MTTTPARDSEQLLRYRRMLRDRLDQVVEQAQRTIRETNNLSITKAQLGNIIAVAQESGSVPVVVGFIQYQMGRSRSPWIEPGVPRESWLGNYIIKRIETEIAALAKEVAGEAGVAPREAHIDLVALYLGYLRRAFIAHDGARRRGER
jgi:hypothetical protein